MLVAEKVSLVDELVARTLVPGTMLPAESRTYPVTSALEDCAEGAMAAESMRKRAESIRDKEDLTSEVYPRTIMTSVAFTRA